MIISILIVEEWRVLGQHCQRNLSNPSSPLEARSSSTNTYQTKITSDRSDIIDAQ